MYYQPERGSYVERAVVDACVALSHIRKPQYRDRSNPLAGMCYVAAEALYHLQPTRYKPMNVRVGNESHWYLIEKRSGAVVDPTWSQFEFVPYEDGVGRGFLTKKPSKRAQQVIDHVRNLAALKALTLR